jgi:hypothetical protein
MDQSTVVAQSSGPQPSLLTPVALAWEDAMQLLFTERPPFVYLMRAPQSAPTLVPTSLADRRAKARPTAEQNKQRIFNKTLRNHKAEAVLMRAEFQRRLQSVNSSHTTAEFLEEAVLALYAINPTVVLVTAILHEAGEQYYIPMARVRTILAKHAVPVVKKTPTRH